MRFSRTEITGNQHAQGPGRRPVQFHGPGQEFLKPAFCLRLVTTQDLDGCLVRDAVSQALQRASTEQRIFFVYLNVHGVRLFFRRAAPGTRWDSPGFYPGRHP